MAALRRFDGRRRRRGRRDDDTSTAVLWRHRERSGGRLLLTLDSLDWLLLPEGLAWGQPKLPRQQILQPVRLQPPFFSELNQETPLEIMEQVPVVADWPHLADFAPHHLERHWVAL